VRLLGSVTEISIDSLDEVACDNSYWILALACFLRALARRLTDPTKMKYILD